MKKKRDLNEIAMLEKAIKEKYGEEAIQTFKENWSDEEEQNYRLQLKSLLEKEQNYKNQDQKVEINGFLVDRKLLTKEGSRICPICGEYSFKAKDDVYQTKYGCCYRCFVINYEDKMSAGE